MKSHKISFIGSGSEYFRIWVVNIALVALSFSLYRPWAKVRTMQYFARNTRLDEASFDYHGKPIAIFKGQMIVLGLLMVANWNPILAGLSGLVGLALLPWVLQRSIGFRLRNTSYRQLRFGFDAPLKVFYGVTGAITFGGLVLGLMLAFAPKDQQASINTAAILSVSFFFALLPLIVLIVVASIRFQSIPYTLWGNKRFGSHLSHKTTLQLVAFILMLLLGVAAFILAFVFLLLPTLGRAAAVAFGTLLVFTLLAFLVGFKAIIAARLHNLAWNGTTLNEARFRSDLSELRYALSSVLVLLFTLITLGLYRPFGTVKLTRMRAESVTVEAENLDDALAHADEAQGSAVGQEAADWFNIDISL